MPDLKSEIANTDRKKFRKDIQERELWMAEFISRLKH